MTSRYSVRSDNESTPAFFQMIFFSEERSAELGPGLATNYWFGFLQTVLLSDDVSDGDGLNIREKLVEYHDQHHYPDQHLCSDKIVILIQTNCDFHPDTLQASPHNKLLLKIKLISHVIFVG